MTNADCQKVTIKHRPPFYIFKRHKKAPQETVCGFVTFLVYCRDGGSNFFGWDFSIGRARLGDWRSSFPFEFCFALHVLLFHHWLWDAGNFHLFRPHRLSCITTCNGTIGCPIPKYSQSLGPFLVSKAILEYNQRAVKFCKGQIVPIWCQLKAGIQKVTAAATSK